MSGIFYGLGVGPGDPELLTVKAVKVLENIDVVIAPKTEKKDGSVALNIAKPYLKENVEIIYQVFPMIKDFANNSQNAWEDNKKEILSLLQSGKNVAFLTIGDPFLYSTYIYVFRLLKSEGVDVRTVPGIPAFVAIASAINYPLTEGDEILTIIPATAEPSKVKKAISNTDNAVLMKVYKNYNEVIDWLEENDMLDEATLVSRAGLNDEKVIQNLKEHKNEKLNYLSTVLAKKNKA